MATSKIWMFFCLIFGILNLKLLIDGYGNVNYVLVDKGDRLYENTTNYVICIQFENLKKWDTLNHRPPTGYVSTSVFLDYALLSIKRNIEAVEKEHLLKLEQSYVFKSHVCYMVSKGELERIVSLPLFLQTYQIRLFVFSNGKQPYFYDYVFFKYEISKSIYLHIYKQKVYGKAYLQNSNCFTFRNQIESGRFRCLDRCFIEKKIDLGFFLHSDTGSFDLNLLMNGRESNLPTKNESALERFAHLHHDEEFQACLNLCPESDCFHETYNSVRIKQSYYEEFISPIRSDQIHIVSKIYTARYSTTDFWLQFFGLLTLFTRTSVVGTLPLLVILISKQFEIDKRRYFALIFSKFKFILVVFSFIFILSHSIQMVNEYDVKFNYPNSTSTLSYVFEIESFKAVICFPVEFLMYGDKIEAGRNRKILEEFTLNEIKNLTRNGSSEIRKAYLAHGVTIEELELKSSEDVLFQNSTFNNQTCLARCFAFKFKFNLFRYEAMIPLNNLLIIFHHKLWQVYLIERRAKFTSGLEHFKGKFYRI